MKYFVSKISFFAFLLCMSGTVMAQQKGVAINKPSLDPGLILDVNGLDGSTRLGTRLSRLSSAPQTPQEGSLYFDTGLNTYRQYTGAAWQNLYNTFTSEWTTVNSTNLRYDGTINLGGDIRFDTEKSIYTLQGLVGNNNLFLYGRNTDVVNSQPAIYIGVGTSSRGGRVGINKSSAAVTLDVDGVGRFSETLWSDRGKFGGNTSIGSWDFEVQGDSYLASGNTYADNLVLKRRDNSGWYEIDIVLSGNVAAIPGPVAAPSDSRLKENIAQIGAALDRVQQLRGVNYDWNTTAKNLFTNQIGTGRVPGPTETENEVKAAIAIEKAQAKEGYAAREVGLIAQEVQAVLPEAVVEAEDGYLRVKYGHLAGLFVEAIKEQQTIIEAQAERIRQLENQQLSVLARLEKLETATASKSFRAED